MLRPSERTPPTAPEAAGQFRDVRWKIPGLARIVREIVKLDSAAQLSDLPPWEDFGEGLRNPDTVPVSKDLRESPGEAWNNID